MKDKGATLSQIGSAPLPKDQDDVNWYWVSGGVFLLAAVGVGIRIVMGRRAARHAQARAQALALQERLEKYLKDRS